MTACRPRRYGTPVWTMAVAALLGMGLSACGSSSKPAASSTPATSTPAASTTAGATVTTASSSKYGTILVDSAGMTLYMLTGDSPKASICTGTCVSIWPPLLTTGSPKASGGADASLLGTIIRSGGAHQVTYNGHPLYTFSHDKAPGQVNGEGIDNFGGIWYVLNASGQPVKGASSPSTTTSSSGGGGYGY